MDSFLNRYRNVATLLVAILVQLVLLGYQVRNEEEVRLVRVWAVSAVTPLASALESTRSFISGFFQDYVLLLDAQEENAQLKQQLGEIAIENHQLRAQLRTAQLAESFALFQQSSPLRTLPAQVIGNTTGSGDAVVIVDRGSRDGVQNGMGAITPLGIVGKVINVFSSVSYVLLATDPSFAAGVVSQNHRINGTAKGQGGSWLRVDYVPNEKPVDPDEWFYTSGDDRIFPRGLPVGKVTEVGMGTNQREIQIDPSGFENGIEAMLIVISGVHTEIPDPERVSTADPVMMPPFNPDAATGTEQAAVQPAQAGPLATDADRIAEQVRALGEAQGHLFGERGDGAPDFNLELDPLPSEQE